MNCSQINEMLDMLMDDELSEDMRAELEAHAETCSDCADNIRATIEMKKMLSDFREDEADVPLAAQAAWRKAIRQEAARQRNRRVFRYAGFAAAALVLAVGVGVSVNGVLPGQVMKQQAAVITEADDAIIQTKNAATGAVVVEADGQGMPAARSAAVPTGGPSMVECSMKVENAEEACSHIEDLVAEYEGTVDIQHVQNGAGVRINMYVNMPSENVEDFIAACAHLDLSDSMTEDFNADKGETTSVLLVLSE